MSKIIKFVISLLFIYLFLFNQLITSVSARDCSIDLLYKDPLVSSSIIDVTVKLSNEAKVAQCAYNITVNRIQKQFPTVGPGVDPKFTLGPGLGPGKYKIEVKPSTSFVGLAQDAVCGSCTAVFEISTGNRGLSCFSCPNGFYYSESAGKVCIKNEDSRWQNGNPNPIANCPPNECNTNTGKCEGAPIQPPTGTGFSLGPTCEPGKCTSAAGVPCDITSRIPPTTGQVIPAGNEGVYTAIGCVPTNPTLLIAGLLRFSAGIGGGISLLLMAFGAFQMITSAGNPDSLKKGQEQFTSAIIGLLFIIFSVLLLQVIGVDILGLPGFK